MSTNAPGTRSLWMDTAGATVFPEARACSVDVAVVGGGIAGLTTAYLLKRAGKRVAVIEMDRVARGNTGLTTAHLTWVVDGPIHTLRKDHGDAHARAVLAAHAAAIDAIERIAREENIACLFARTTAYRFGARAKDRHALERDAADALALGRECAYVGPDAVPLPAPGGAMRVPDQARFHPLMYALQLALTIPGARSHVFEHSTVTSMREVGGGWELTVGDAIVTAAHVVMATHSPSGIVPQVQTRIEPYQSYALAVQVARGTLAAGLYWDNDDPYHYVRVDPGADHDTIVLGGEDHKTGEIDDTRTPHRALERYLREVLGVTEYKLTHEWSGQVLESADGIALIGRLPAGGANRWIATGFGGNGITYGTIAGMVLCDRVLGVENPWQDVFDPARIKPLASATQFVKANLDVAYRMVHDRIAPAECSSVDEVPVGDGRIVRVGGKKLAVYRDDGGALHAMSPVCTHMGCLVDWNAKERTWDCACHGSRFAATGEVHTGPATVALAHADVADADTTAKVPAR